MSVPALSLLIRALLRATLPPLALAVAIAGVSLTVVGHPARDAAPPFRPQNSATGEAESALSKLPLYFIENKGQTDPRVGYYLQGSKASLYFTDQGVTYALTSGQRGRISAKHRADATTSRDVRRWIVRQEFLGANRSARPEGMAGSEAVVSYFKGSPGQWKTGIPTHSSLVYKNLWPGIDLTYSGSNGLKYTFTVRPGADPSVIRLAYRGAQAVRLNAAGELEIGTPLGGFRDGRPVAWQQMASGRTPVPTSYDLENGRYGFHVGGYDPTKPLVIDPPVIIYAGFIGGSGSEDETGGIAVDSTGAAYVTGGTPSTETTFPDVIGPDLSHNGDYDAFVAKVGPAGSGLAYAGFIGGAGSDSGRAIAVDSTGAAYVAGSTTSASATFPEKGGPDLSYNGGFEDAFVAKVNASGTGLTYAGYIGGLEWDYATGIDVSNNFAYVSGYTDSDSTSFPETVGPDLSYNLNGDAFVAKVKADGTGLTYAGYIGGGSYDQGRGIDVEGTNAYVTGQTSSTASTFPEKAGPDLSSNGGNDAFVAKVNSSGSSLVYCGYLGGSGEEYGSDIAARSGAAYVAGRTNSTEATFPEKLGPDLTFNGGDDDAFVSKVKSDGTALVYAGYIGGNQYDEAIGIAVDARGGAYVTGQTDSDQTTFPEISGPDLTYNGGGDAFVAKVSQSGGTFTYAGYIGGSSSDAALEIAVDGVQALYIQGITGSDQTTFPEIVGPDVTFNGPAGGWDVFVAKVANNLLANGDFEIDGNADNRPDSWTSSPRFTRSNTAVFSGSFSGKHQAVDNANYTIEQLLRLTAGKYQFHGYVHIPTTSDTFSFIVSVRWFNSNGGTISTTTVANYQGSTGWNRFSANLTAPSGTTTARVRMQAGSLNAVIYVDRFVFTKRL